MDEIEEIQRDGWREFDRAARAVNRRDVHDVPTGPTPDLAYEVERLRRKLAAVRKEWYYVRPYVAHDQGPTLAVHRARMDSALEEE